MIIVLIVKLSFIYLLITEVYFSKAPRSVVVVLGMAILFNEVHPAKAPSPILVTELGIEMLFNDVQPLKVLLPIVVAELGTAILSKDIHPSKAPSAIE